MSQPALAAVRLVAFDVDYTLLRPNECFEAPGYRELGLRFGFDLDIARWPLAERAAFEIVRERRSQHGDVHDGRLMQAIAEAVVRALGGDDEARVHACAQAQIERWHQVENFTLYDDVLPCLERLDQASVAMALISNTTRDLLEAVEHFGLSRFVAAAAASADVGVMKPDPRIFNKVLDELGLAPACAAMVGDSYHDDVLGARAAGMQGVLLDRAARSTRDVPTVHSLDELPALLGI